jgi:gliding motility associated protien GldN
MKKLFLIPVLLMGFLFTGSNVKAQVQDDIYTKEHVPNRRPVPYKFLREADAMREKINLNLYYPTEPIGQERKSLIDLLMWGITTEGLYAYNTEDDRFTQPMSRTQIETAFGATETQIPSVDEDGNEIMITVKNDIKTTEVKQYWLKEDWFFDRQHSTMEVRIIGLCPIRFYVKDNGTGEDAEPRKSQLFWIYFPEVRRILANHEVFNNNNDAERRTFDDIFFKRYFNSFIFKVSNVYDDRGIAEYSLGIQSLLEAEALKETITNFEQDLWEY